MGRRGRPPLAWLLPCAALLLGGCAGPAPNRQNTLPPRPLEGHWHQVRQGERLPDLARRYRVALLDIEEINGVDRSEALTVGHPIFIPGASSTVKKSGVKAGAGSDQAPPPPSASSSGRQGGTGLLWPVKGGTLTSTFSPRGGRPHEGIDIAAKEGTAVLAAADGQVIYAGSGLRGYGNLILVQHADKLVTVYAHNRKNLVAEGEKVKRGQVIAEVGHTGRASGNHLHFEIRRGEVPQDPLRFLREPGRGRRR